MSALYSIKCFLSDRKQQVRLGNQLCKLATVTSGVPQGSVLGPILFLIFIEELIEVLYPLTFVKGFAVDLKMYMSINLPTDHAVLQRSPNVLSDWSISWQMKIAAQNASGQNMGELLLQFLLQIYLFLNGILLSLNLT